MKRVIHKIRQKPDHHKDRIIWISAAAAVAVLLIIWAIVGNGRPTAPDENFFQQMSEDIEQNQDTFPADPLVP